MKKRRLLLTILYCVFLTLVILTFLFSILGFKNRSADYSFDDQHIHEWNDGWLVSVDEGPAQVMSLPLHLECDDDSLVTIEKTLEEEKAGHNSLMFESKRQTVYVYIDDELRMSYTDQGQRIGNSLPYSYVFVPLYTSDAGKTIRISFQTNTYYSGNIDGIFLGDEMSLLLMLIKGNIAWLAVIGVIIIIGAICLGCYFIYKKSYDGSILLLFMFWFALFTATWCFSQLKIRQIFAKDVPMLESIGHCCFMLVPIPVLLIVDNVLEFRYRKIYQGVVVMAMINFLTQNILHTGLGVDYFELQVITQLFYLGIFTMSTVLCIRVISLKQFRKMHYLFLGLVMPVMGILAEAICTGYNIKYTQGCYFLLGSLIFLISNLMYFFVSNSIEQQKKKDAENANRAKSRFLATMSHEIRTPINAVLGMNEIIMRDTKEETTRQYANDIAEAGKSLLSLVNDILDFSRIEAGKMDIVCVDYSMKSPTYQCS